MDGFYTYTTIENNTCYRIAHRGFAFLCKITQFFFFLSTKVDYTLCVWPAERWVDHQTLNHLDISMISINYYPHILLQSPWLIVIYYNLLEKYLNNLYRKTITNILEYIKIDHNIICNSISSLMIDYWPWGRSCKWKYLLSTCNMIHVDLNLLFCMSLVCVLFSLIHYQYT